MLSHWLVGLHRRLRTDFALKMELGQLPCSRLGEPTQEPAFYDSNVVRVLEDFVPGARDALTVSTEEKQKNTISILQLDGLFAGKRPTDSTYTSLKEFSGRLKPAQEYPELNRIGFETELEFEKNVRYFENNRERIAGYDDGILRVYYREWDNKYFLMNYDGAHHVAAIYRQCLEQGRNYTFSCLLTSVRLDRPNCNRLLSHAHFLLLTTECAGHVRRILLDFGHIPAPNQHEYSPGRTLLCINRNLKRADDYYRLVASGLSEQTCFDLSGYLRTALNS
jgi:hypothetical protein